MNSSGAAPVGANPGRYRWRICAVLFLATTINYVDRNVLSFTMLDDAFRRQMVGLAADAPLDADALVRFKELMGYVDAAFKFAYAAGFLLAGYLIDRVGTRRGYGLSIGVWVRSGEIGDT